MTSKEIPTMNSALGSVRQLGFVIRDLDRALEYWTKLSVVVAPGDENYLRKGRSFCQVVSRFWEVMRSARVSSGTDKR
jgi:hypothetical protein